MGGKEKALIVRLTKLEDPRGALVAMPGDRVMEFHISRKARDELEVESSLFTSTGNVIIPDFAAARSLARRINEKVDASLLPEKTVRAGRLNAMALIDEILHDVARLYREGPAPSAFSLALGAMESSIGPAELDRLLLAFIKDFPPLDVYREGTEPRAWLSAAPGGIPNRILALEEFVLLRLANENPAFAPYRFLFDDGSREGEAPVADGLAARPAYAAAMAAIESTFASLPKFGPDSEDLVTMLRSPMRASPFSLPGQLDFIRKKWGLVLGERMLHLLGALDLIREEEKPRFPGPGPTRAYVYRGMETESERFSPDKDWMPNVVMIAKSTLVWLDQLSRSYGRDIRSLDAVPDEELDQLALRGFNALWLIGLWERSAASAEIKRRCGNPEAAASAYALFDYEISGELGGWAALERLRERCGHRGIRLAADMVPNHTGIDSAWVRGRSDVFMTRSDCPYPGYTFNGPDLSGDARVGIWIEDHYWDRSDAAVVFKRLDRATGREDYVYHGNDGTGLPWSDTAQIDFLKGAAREAVKERILHVARNFPIIRFDAAMVLAKKHFRRLWYPEPGSGGDVPSRSESGLGLEAFDKAFPVEFWREVVDMCAKETPDTLLLAEAFWMMEGYFVRTLGMHRVYNSAFMNMLKREENAKYRETIRNTQEFDKDILKRFVNFMNNPDEDTAVAQFGKGDKYFGVCTMMATMPGLPMFGHGQLDGFEEKYGMEYRRAYRDERPDEALVRRHEAEIYPLLKRRRLFSGVEEFLLYDLVEDGGQVNENTFAWSNGSGGEKALVLFNNSFARAGGRLRESCVFAEKDAAGEKRLLRRSIQEAFGLHCEEGRFLVMREDRSGLWFIRRSPEICERGLQVILDGYQSQVFMDIFEVTDDERGLYSAVCEALGGRGVPDLGEAVEDVALKDLYASLSAFANAELFEAARRLVEAELTPAARRKELKLLCDRVSPLVLDFYSGVVCLLQEESTEAGLPSLKKATEARDRFLADLGNFAETAILAGSATGAAGATLVLDFLSLPGSVELSCAYFIMDGLRALAGKPATGKPATGKQESGTFTAAKATLPATVGADPGEAARRVAERIFLERKLREALRSVGVAGDEAHRGLSLAAIFLGKSAAFAGSCGAYLESLDAAHAALALIDAFAKDDELRARLGVNVFEGIQWFNKERFDEVLRFGTMVISLSAGEGDHAGSPKPKTPELALRLEKTAGMAALFAEAEAASGFKVEQLVGAIRERASSHTPASAPASSMQKKAPLPKPSAKAGAPKEKKR